MAIEKGNRPIIVALIPCFRPDSHLQNVTAGLAALPDISEIVIVDDGSGPDAATLFADAARTPRVRVLHHPENRGKGAALKTGIRDILDRAGPEVGIVTVDADGQHAPEDVAAVARALAGAPDALVLGVRAFDGNVPFRSAIGNMVTRRILKLFHGIDIADTQTGLRAFGGAFAAKAAELSANRYEFELDMLLLAKADNVGIEQVPIRTIYLDGNKSSHFNVLRDSSRIYFSLLRFSLASITAAAIDNLVFAAAFAVSGSILGSQVASRAVALVVNYAMLKRMVFHSRTRHSVTLPRYLASVFVLAAVSYGLILGCVETFAMPPIAAKILVETLIFTCSFLIQRFFVFPQRRD